MNIPVIDPKSLKKDKGCKCHSCGEKPVELKE